MENTVSNTKASKAYLYKVILIYNIHDYILTGTATRVCGNSGWEPPQVLECGSSDFVNAQMEVRLCLNHNAVLQYGCLLNITKYFAGRGNI